MEIQPIATTTTSGLPLKAEPVGRGIIDTFRSARVIRIIESRGERSTEKGEEQEDFSTSNEMLVAIRFSNNRIGP